MLLSAGARLASNALGSRQRFPNEAADVVIHCACVGGVGNDSVDRMLPAGTWFSAKPSADSNAGRVASHPKASCRKRQWPQSNQRAIGHVVVAGSSAAGAGRMRVAQRQCERATGSRPSAGALSFRTFRSQVT